ncbi:hypothetical protein ACIQ7N_09505 [Lysinibacillus sp. NPDC095746]|uniref:hypothetical protein n=1 Tax=Lysinibacillus sp. NPDC095746 TaxID=3364134 RepID=UPI00381705FA
MFKKKILIGHSEDTVLAIIEHLEKSNIPFEIEIKGVLKRSSEEYEGFYMVKVQKKCAKQVEAIVAQYVSQEDLKHWYKVEKKKSRKLERKEKAFYLFAAFIYFIAVVAIEMGKAVEVDIVSYFGCVVLLLGGVFMTTYFYKEMKKESGDLREINKQSMIFPIGIIFYAVSSFISVFLY